MKLRTAVVLGVGVAFLATIALELPFANGPAYFKWEWRSEAGPGCLPLLLLTALPFLFAVYRLETNTATPPVMPFLAALVGANLLLQIVALSTDPGGLSRVRRIVSSPVITSYYSDALKVDAIGPWLDGFAGTKRKLHSATHPPGPILYYRAWIRLLGPSEPGRRHAPGGLRRSRPGATAGGVGVGVIGSLGVAVAYLFAGLWTREEKPRLIVALLYALMPSLTVFFPEFDQIYPVFAMAILYAWVRALDGKVAWAVAAGFGLFVGTFFAYNLLVLGAFMAPVGLMLRKKEAGGWAGLAARCAACVGTWAALNVLLSAATGFDPIDSFRAAVAHQKAQEPLMNRPWAMCLGWDLYDFCLGAGMMAAPLAGYAAVRAWRERGANPRVAVLTLIGLSTILVVDLSGLLRVETARVWMFMQPLLLVPAGLELARFPRSHRAAIMLLQWIILAALKSKLVFISY